MIRSPVWLLFMLTIGVIADAAIEVNKVEAVVYPRSDSYDEKPHGLAYHTARFDMGADVLKW